MIVDQAQSFLTFAAALGCGVIGGVFFAFSIFVMKALARRPPAQGIAAMQSINVVVLNPWFLGVFLGTAIACAALAIWALLAWEEPGAAFRLAGGIAYVAGTFGVTMACNVPRNHALASVDPESAAGAEVWADYLRSWTAWNHVRSLAAIVATALFFAAR